RRTPGSPLHTNFKLDSEGEYLALIKPDLSIATEFAPSFPPQLPDTSYGPAAQTTKTLAIQPGAAGKVLVPVDDSLGTTWTASDFIDTAWTNATNGIGFETGANEFGSFTPGNLQDGPAGYYRLEETGSVGLTAANTGSTGIAGIYLSGTTQNVATLQSPAYPGFESDNQGTRFNGTTHKIDVPYHAAHGGPSFSFSFWMKWNGSIPATHKSPLTLRESVPQRGFIAYILPNTQQLSFWTGAETAWSALDAPAATGTIAANTWYHVAGTFDGTSKLKVLYLNGAQVASTTIASYSPATQFPLRIGAGATEGAGQFWFPGDVDEVAIFNRALTSAEVSAQYTAATTGTDAPGVILGQTPVSYFRLKDATTASPITAVNQGTAGPSANGAYTGSPVLGVDGPRPPSEAGMPAGNRALRANSAGYVETPYSASLNPSVFTVECWARATGGAGTFRAAVSGRNDDGAKTYGYIFYAASNNTWQFWTGSGAGGVWDPITGPAVTLNTWVHLAGTYDGTVKKFYVNGTLAGTGTLATFNPNTVRGLRIGAGMNEAAANFLFAGDVDEVAIYSRALSATEIAQRYQYGKNNTPPPALNDFTGLVSTSLQSQMLGNNASAYFRIPFNVADAGAIGALTLKMKYDDGFQAWLNGVPVAGGNVPETLTWNSAASDRSSNAEAVVFESFNLNSALSSLHTGQNVLAIQGLNLSASNPDFLQLAQLELTNAGAYSANPVYLTQPTPGAVNGTGSSNPGPSISQETLSPAAPLAADDLTITCKVRPVFSPVTAVTLNWRTAYNAVQQIAMVDDATNGDATAGDGIYTAVIPKTNYTAGAMVRWYFTAADSAANTSRWPVFTAGDEAPEYFGTMIAATGFTTTLPVWYWFAQNTAAAATRGGTFGSVFYNGEFYDNVFIRLRGGATSTGSKKFDFNSGHHCRIDDTVGRVEEANLNGTSLASGIGGDSADATLIRPALAYEIYRTSGHPGGWAFPLMMRVNGAL
ncbi:MAG TPA: LamG domain-containing protein, partial [Verrucomicrobiales bacterium]|nr:LamG domain-containing protein [Verrucomicrobiales bacterium]